MENNLKKKKPGVKLSCKDKSSAQIILIPFLGKVFHVDFLSDFLS